MNSISQKCQSKKPITSCNSKKNDSKNSTLADMVDEYLKEHGNSYDWEDKWWGDRNITWSEAIERAWRSLMENGKMHGHQRRVAHKLKEGLEFSLSDNIQPDDFNNFESIYSWIKSVTDRVKGLGVTTAYDVARRLGAWLNMLPTMVYLHAGAAEGAKKLGIEGETVSLNDFPQEIQKLGAVHAENFLCIYKNRL
ncbi:MAG: hypothetical protein SWZ49_33735 [Cyanobacteriota bacterium]|nr:hypothetical protein [Cyanobacteriota bacterium]